MFRFTHLMDPWALGGPGTRSWPPQLWGWFLPAQAVCTMAGYTTAVPSVGGQELVGTHSSFSASRETIYRLSVPSQDAAGKWIPTDQRQFLFLFFSYKHVSSDLDDTGLSSFHCPPASGGIDPRHTFCTLAPASGSELGGT